MISLARADLIPAFQYNEAVIPPLPTLVGKECAKCRRKFKVGDVVVIAPDSFVIHESCAA